MKVSKKIILYLPHSFSSDLDQRLLTNPPNFSYKKEYFFYIIYYLSEQQIKYKKKKEFRLDLKFLKSVTASNIRSYITFLKKGEFIITNGSYQSGRESLKYILNPKYVNGEIIQYVLEEKSRLYINIVKMLKRRKAHYNRLEPFLKKMCKEVMSLEMDYVKADEWVLDNAEGNKISSYLIALNQIEDIRFRYFKRNKTNYRLDTNFTNLKKELRHFIKGNYINIDLKNSQPFLLAILIKNIIDGRETLCRYLDVDIIVKHFGIKAFKKILLIHQNQKKTEMVNFKAYYNSVISGGLYESIMEAYDNSIKRDDAKDMMYKVLFSKNIDYKYRHKFIPYEKEKQMFNSVYPMVYEVSKLLKGRNHKQLSIFLQKFESYLFIDCIAKELVNNGIVPITIHDSVMVKVEDQEKTIEIMKSIFLNQIGIIPTLNIKAV